MHSHSPVLFTIYRVGIGACLCFLITGCTPRPQSVTDYSLERLPSPTISAVPSIINQASMILTSSAFQHLDYIPAKYTCDSDNVSPPLAIAQVNPNAKSLALIVDDPDAPAGDWVHWLVWNLPADIKVIETNQLPRGAVEGLNDFGQQNWGGPCPPSGVHRYQFKLYALDTTLALDNTATKPQLLAALKDHILEETMLVGLYKKR